MKNNKLYVILALVLAVAAGGSAYYFLYQTQQQYLPENMVISVQAVQDIEPGTQITSEMVKKVSVPASISNKKAVRQLENAVGQTVTQKIYAGEEVLRDRLLSTGDKSRLAYKIPSGHRAIAVAVDEVSGIAGQIKAGDRVDMTCFIETGDGTGKQMTSLLLLQNIEVLQAPELSLKGTDDAGKIARTVILAVTPYQAQAITLADSKGKVRLILRQMGENGTQALPPMLVPSLLAPGFGG